LPDLLDVRVEVERLHVGGHEQLRERRRVEVGGLFHEDVPDGFWKSGTT